MYKCLNADASFKIIVWRYFWADDINIYGALAIEVKNGIMTKLKSIDEKNDKADFWTKVLGDLNKAKDLPNAPEFLLRQFVTWFVPSE